MNYFVWHSNEKPPLQAMMQAMAKNPAYRIYTPIDRIEPYYEAVIALDTTQAEAIYLACAVRSEDLFCDSPKFVLWNDSEEFPEDEPIIYYFEDYAVLH